MYIRVMMTINYYQLSVITTIINRHQTQKDYQKDYNCKHYPFLDTFTLAEEP